MKSDTSYFLIGLFVIAACGVLAVSIVALSGEEQKGEVILAETLTGDSVNGLEVGADVLFRGVKVGLVKDVAIAGNIYPERPENQGNTILIRFTISPLTAGTNLSADELRENIIESIGRGMRVRLASSGLSPQAHLEINIDPETAARHESPQPYWTSSEYVFMPSVPSRLEGLAQSLESTFDRLGNLELEGLIDDARKAIQAIEKGVTDLRLEEVPDEVKGLIAKAEGLIDAARVDLDLVTGDARTAIQRIEAAAAEAEKLLAEPKIRDILNHTDEAVVAGRDLLRSPKIGEILDHTNEFIVDLKGTVARTEEAIVAARVLIRDGSHVIRGNEREIAAVIDNLRQVTQSLANLSRTLERYPSIALFGNPPPKKEKEEDENQ